MISTGAARKMYHLASPGLLLTLPHISVTVAKRLSLFSLLGGRLPKITSIAQLTAEGKVSHPTLP